MAGLAVAIATTVAAIIIPMSPAGWVVAVLIRTIIRMIITVGINMVPGMVDKVNMNPIIIRIAEIGIRIIVIFFSAQAIPFVIPGTI